MDFKWKIFKIILYLSLVLTLSTITAWKVFYMRLSTVYHPGMFVALLYIGLSFLLIYTLTLTWLMHKKFPNIPIKQRMQDVMKSISVFLFVVCLYLIGDGVLVLDFIFRTVAPLNELIRFYKYLAIATIGLSVLHIYIGVNSFLMLNTINKNRLELMREISRLGS